MHVLSKDFLHPLKNQVKLTENVQDMQRQLKEVLPFMRRRDPDSSIGHHLSTERIKRGTSHAGPPQEKLPIPNSGNQVLDTCT